ncbi:hypothetical protein [Streptomyces sp. BH055]|uniref:hypothetical protein n=1 Tax=unclassified Streptomyces TaxID=2593676 RepID=UPI003BB62D4E
MSDAERSDTTKSVIHLSTGAGKTRTALALWDAWQRFGAEEQPDDDSTPIDFERANELLLRVHAGHVTPLPDDLEDLSQKHLFVDLEDPRESSSDAEFFKGAAPLSDPLRMYAIANNYIEFMKEWTRELDREVERAKENSTHIEDLLLLYLKRDKPARNHIIHSLEFRRDKRNEEITSRIYSMARREILKDDWLQTDEIDHFRELRVEVKRYLEKSQLFVLGEEADDPRGELATLVQSADTFMTAVDETGRLSLVIAQLKEPHRPAQEGRCPPCDEQLHTYGAVLELPVAGHGTRNRSPRSDHRSQTRSVTHTIRRAPKDPALKTPSWRFPENSDEFEAGLERAMSVLASV